MAGSPFREAVRCLRQTRRDKCLRRHDFCGAGRGMRLPSASVAERSPAGLHGNAEIIGLAASTLNPESRCRLARRWNPARAAVITFAVPASLQGKGRRSQIRRWAMGGLIGRTGNFRYRAGLIAAIQPVLMEAICVSGINCGRRERGDHPHCRICCNISRLAQATRSCSINSLGANRG